MDDTGATKTTYVYDAFGNATATGEISNNPFQFTSRENDETGLYNYRNRYFSFNMQRFVSEDPIRLRGGINYYSYVGDSPINHSDPTGLFWPLDCGRCFYYMKECLDEGRKCSKEESDKEKSDPDYIPEKNPDDLRFEKCYRDTPACQKKLEFCTKCGLTPKGGPGVGPLIDVIKSK